ncbi:MAG: pyruvate kinase, partial [Sphingomonadales bacterium]
MRRERRTRIIATLGPASSDVATIEALYRAGADVFRVNMSHGELKERAALIRNVRIVEEKVGRPIAIMADLQGPKIRIATFEGGEATLEEGASFTLDSSTEPGDGARVGLPHPEILAALEPGATVLLDDGRIRLEVEKASKKKAECRVTMGGVLSNRKGVNLPGIVLPLAALTDKDRKDLEFALLEGVDWIALSFVQRPEDVAEARKLVRGQVGILSKIEKPTALPHLDRILELSDAVMVARGDLGVEARVEEVPSIQRDIIKRARRLGKPVVVATQMLETMIHSP